MATINSLSTLLLPLVFTLVVDAGAPRRALAATDTAAQFLNPQNAVRLRLGLPPLQWSAQLASYAKWYAGQRRGDCALIHSTADYGENLFWGKGKGWSIAAAVAAWTVQQQFYDYGRNQCAPNRDCTHYTQIVWRTTQRVGCAKIVCDSGDTFVACEYDPHGNIIGQRPY